MDTAYFFALFWGWLTIIMTVIYFARPSVLAQVKTIIVEARGFSLIYGMVSLILGLASAILVHAWTLDWRGLTTLFGWLALVKGIIVLAWPEISQKTPYKTRITSTRVSLAIVCALAVTLLVVVYRA